MQLLFDGSEENGGVEGLGIIPGRVTKFDTSLGLPVPHIGWNTLEQRYTLLRCFYPGLHLGNADRSHFSLPPHGSIACRAVNPDMAFGMLAA